MFVTQIHPERRRDEEEKEIEGIKRERGREKEGGKKNIGRKGRKETREIEAITEEVERGGTRCESGNRCLSI